MSHAPRNNCICSNCFVRNYELFNYKDRSAGGKKRGSLTVKQFRPLTAEEVERTFWKAYLQKLKDDRRRAKVVIGVWKPPKKVKEVEIAYEIHPSKVFLESPTSANDCRQIMDVDHTNFWNCVYGEMWKGRIRVCEGELMYKITETLKTLVSKRKIANFTVKRIFTAQNTDNEEDSTPTKERQPSKVVVRVDQTYYGGVPRKVEKMVRFNLVPNSVFTPRLISLSPILKRNKNLSREVAGLKSPNASPATESITSGAGKHEPTLGHNIHSGKKRDVMHIFSPSVTKDDFTSMCLKATQDFIVTKEMITNSRSLKSSTFFTLRRKETLSGTNEIAETMKDFYTSASLSEHSKGSRELTPIIEMD
ncbi:uncharacterized protein LOC144633128 [Oculina patagonica]